MHWVTRSIHFTARLWIVLAITGIMFHRPVDPLGEKMQNELNEYASTRDIYAHPCGPGYYVIRYPYQATELERLGTIDYCFPRLIGTRYRCRGYYVVHPDESGYPRVSNGRGEFPGRDHVDKMPKWKRHEFIKLCGFTPGEPVEGLAVSR